MITDRFVVDVVIMYIDDFVNRIFALECNKREPWIFHSNKPRTYVHYNDSNMNIQGGPAKVRPTYICDGNIWMHG